MKDFVIGIGIVSIIVGILVLVLPGLLQWLVGIGLIIIGVLALFRRS